MNKSQYLLIVSTALLFALGLMMVFNTTSAHILDRSLTQDIYYPLFKQLVYFLIGVVFGCAVYFIGYEKIIANSFYFYVITILLLCLVFIPQLGVEIKGAKRWINLGSFSFQPSEIAKYTIGIYFLSWVAKQRKVTVKDFLSIIGLIALPLMLILIEPDNGTCVIMILSFVVLFLLTKIPWMFWAMPLLCFVLIGSFFAYHMPHVPGRIFVYLNPEQDLKGKGHQPYQAKIAAGSGRILGKGLGKSIQKLSYLPEARSDYIAAIYAEEFGFIGMVTLILLYMLIAFCGYFIALNAQDIRGFYIGAFISFLIAFQAFLNLGIVSGLLPSKGTTLPFFSQGGTSLIMNVVAVSLLLSCAKTKKIKIDEKAY